MFFFFNQGFEAVLRINCGGLLFPTAESAIVVFVVWSNFLFQLQFSCTFLLSFSSSLVRFPVSLFVSFIYITELKFHEAYGEAYIFLLFSFERPYEAKKFAHVAALGYYNLIFSFS